jgi:hypothetical protein
MTEEENQPAPPLAASQETQLERLESAVLPYDGTESSGDVLAWLAPFLKPIDPPAFSDAGLAHVVTIVREKTSGNDGGPEFAATAEFFEHEDDERESKYVQLGDMLAPYWFVESIAQGDPLMFCYGEMKGY